MIPVIPGFFNLVQVHNTGAAFGMLRDNNLFFMVLSFSALIILAILGWKGVFVDGPSRWAVRAARCRSRRQSDRPHAARPRGRFSRFHPASVRTLARVQRGGLLHLHRRGIVHSWLIPG